ncbi:MAG: TIGR00730 family Rossman fold protein [Spirochaetaceae bacterium]|nr:TIGR00730 family Rossman fold protein [Myxococcales bacterium]MCB9725006.1 TIGR00730 family Rossman fold protein [Spirochaetaceae bacterium]HPG25406.1 TIGR00730 family Rossman fold protein [Myxococcota bacterium]
MSPAVRRRYQLRQSELNDQIEALVEAARHEDTDPADAELVRQLLVTGVHLLRDRTSRAELKLVNSALKELRHAFRVFAPYSRLRKVAVFGSARTHPDHPDWINAHRFAERIVREGWMVITGAGDGIMGAAQGGAGRESSFGVNIRLPFEQRANETIAGDEKLINFRYFFTRKVVFVKEAHAIALFPGGFGTHDEGFEALTLVQTGKSEMVPIVFVDEPGGSYWKEWLEYVETHLAERGLIDPADLELLAVTDSVDEAVNEIEGFYRNYHSSRYVGGRLVMRLHVAPTDEELEAINDEFAGRLLESGRIERTGILPEEDAETAHLPRLRLHFNRKKVGELRKLIDRLNGLAEAAAPPIDARRRAIFASPVPDDQVDAELEEGD